MGKAQIWPVEPDGWQIHCAKLQSLLLVCVITVSVKWCSYVKYNLYLTYRSYSYILCITILSDFLGLPEIKFDNTKYRITGIVQEETRIVNQIFLVLFSIIPVFARFKEWISYPPNSELLLILWGHSEIKIATPSNL